MGIILKLLSTIIKYFPIGHILSRYITLDFFSPFYNNLQNETFIIITEIF